MSELGPTGTGLEPTATERLRALLDERGVEWSSPSGLNSSFADSITFIGDVAVVSEIEGSDLLRINFDGTPEQAIAATLGSSNCSNSERTETCHPVISDNLTESEGTGDAWADCSECGHLLFVLTDPNSQVPNFCPNCGRRIEVDDG